MNIKKTTPLLSVIVPLFNEERRLKNLSKIYLFLNSLKINFELILVNDGSTDNTLRLLKKLPKKFRINLVTYEINKGKGFAVRSGMLSAKGKYLLFTDIDLSTPIEELVKFFPYFKEGDVIIGSRKLKGSRLQKHQPWLREILGKGFTFLSQKILKLEISDFTCGFKCFSKIVAEDLFNKQQINGWGFDSEILFLAKKSGYKIKEIPVKWSNDPRSRVKFPQDIITSLVDLFTIRINDFKKMYDNKK